MRKISKKAEGMSMTGVLIALIILVIAAVVLILAFTGRLGGFWEILGLKSSLSDTTKSCQIACASSDVTGYCVQSRSVKGIPDSITDIGTKKVKNGGVDGVTCMQLEVATGLVCDAQEIKSNVKCTQSSEPQILAFEVTEKPMIFSEEECKSGLEQRKKYYKIPEKFCYWEAISKVYLDKCINLDKTQVDSIFQKKAEYRKLKNEAWPSLVTLGDFCIPVIYDCDAWKKTDINGERRYRAGGFYNKNSLKDSPLNPSISGNPSGEIQINPYMNLSKDIVFNTVLLHEGLHAIQYAMFGDTHLAEGKKYSGGIFGQMDTGGNLANFMKLEAVWSEMEKNVDFVTAKIDDVIKENSKNSLARMKDVVGGGESEETKAGKINQIENETSVKNNLLSYTKNAIELPRFQIVEPNALKENFEKNVKKVLAENNLVSKDIETNLSNILKLNENVYYLTYEYKAKGYIGSKVEIDPRLSEVQRWWLDKTAPNCEIILDKEKAKEVLDKFLAEKNIADVYSYSQQDLNLLIYIYKGTKYENEVYNNLIMRLPGLAYSDTGGEITA